DKDNVISRTAVLNKLATRNAKPVIVTYPEALLERVVSRKKLHDHTLVIHKGDHLDMQFVTELLDEYRFERTDFVWEPGQFAVRGGIIDLFSYSASHPCRIEFVGNEVGSIRIFDVENQLTLHKTDRIAVVPNLNQQLEGEAVQTLFDFLPEHAQCWVRDLEFSLNRIDQILTGIDVSASDELRKLSEAVTEEEEEGMLDPAAFREKLVGRDELLNRINQVQIIEFGTKYFFPGHESFFFNITHQPAFNKNFDLLRTKIQYNLSEGYQTYLLSDNQKQLDRLTAILATDEEAQENHHTQPNTATLSLALHEGYYDHDLKLALFTDHQIFERYHKFKIRSGFKKREALNIRQLTDLHPGDYIVHVDHGIGQFGGLETVEINGRKQESIRLVYKNRDVLYVSIHSLHRISKYKGKEGETPKVHKLGSGAWQAQKARTKSKIKDIAKDLIQLYARRKETRGFAFSGDTYLQHELEASFIYEDTPDQVKATAEVKADMESVTPADRLVCGDVGFGKTEVAIRAAFKSVADSKQVAVLVPTTILALQHYKTFSERLADFPCKVDYISRLRSAKEQNRIIRELQEGKIDILIGTHKLIGKSLKFKDLGLLIIDEEQKFGVSAKEKLRQMKMNVDTLTLTATPIPRTLQFSMMGARDLSIINTPPPNRQPIITELHTLNEELIREVIEYELERGGQVFFIHNRVQNIEEVEALLKRVVPKARTITAHGQMEGRMLEDRMLGFINGDYDVLIATSIIENGLDIPNANTMIINNAHHFGLSDLHQLRGRVGRSNKRAFCYLIAPPMHLLTPDARRRLKAISEFSELGSGLNIALQDLDIRGAGNLLGAEQSGFIADIGFETYQKILNEAMAELKEETARKKIHSGTDAENDKEESDHKAEKRKSDTEENTSERPAFVSDVSIDSDLELLIPEDYIESTSERIRLYRELDELTGEADLKQFTGQLTDRFGELPGQTRELLLIVPLRQKAGELGIERIMLKKNRMVLYFISDPESSFYQSAVFSGILNYVQQNPRKCSMKENNGKLTLTFTQVAHVHQALGILQTMTKQITK
ncbi:MAG: transcription-repair coupling factor, partial [Bacteroidales bacterium]|nr:transcription-repair coupling factor [Bacteroidales bacterium]